jgi:hypothetical protein
MNLRAVNPDNMLTLDNIEGVVATAEKGYELGLRGTGGISSDF